MTAEKKSTIICVLSGEGRSQIRQVQHIFGEIQVVMGKGSPDIIIFLIPALRKLLEFGNDQVIAARPVPERTHMVMARAR